MKGSEAPSRSYIRQRGMSTENARDRLLIEGAVARNDEGCGACTTGTKREPENKTSRMEKKGTWYDHATKGGRWHARKCNVKRGRGAIGERRQVHI